MLNKNKKISLAIIGLGYVGLPLALEFGKKRSVIGFDINKHRINELIYGYHGGEFETSIMLYLFPKLVRQSKIAKHKLSPDSLLSKTISYEKTIKKAWVTKELSKSGIIGDPRKSNAQIGKKIIDRVTQKLNKIINEMT